MQPWIGVPFATFIAPARVYCAVWRIAAVVLGFEIAFSLTPGLIAPFIEWNLPVESPILTLLDFAAFVLPALALIGLIRLFHHRGLRTLVGPAQPFWRDLGRVLIAVCLVLLVQQPVLLWPDLPFVAQVRNPAIWALWLLPALVAIAVQVSTEEIYFRGYLTQQLAVLSSYRRVWLLVPSVYFGGSHLLNGNGLADGVLWAAWAGALGAACGDLTARTGNLGAAIGLHLGNNLFATVVIGVTNMPGSGLALLLLPPEDVSLYTGALDTLWTPLTLLDVAVGGTGVAVMWLAARVAVRA